MTQSFNVSLAPDKLWQAINPWTFMNQGAQFGLVNISLGQTPHPEIEEDVLTEVGSYGRQIGRIGDALAVLIAHIDQSKLSDKERETLRILDGQLAQIDAIKRRGGGTVSGA